MNHKDTIISIHIPKTAGSTLAYIMTPNFQRSEIYVPPGPDYADRINEFKQWSDEKKEKIRFMRGHMPFGLHEYMNQECRYITVLRDPVERAISYYHFILSDKKHPLNSYVVNNSLGFEEFIKSELSVEMDNGQTRILCGDDKVKWYGPMDRHCPKSAFEEAKHNIINSFTTIGLTERFEDTLVMLSLDLGMDINVAYESVNKTISRPARSDVDENIIRLIQKYNEYDMEIYRLAVELFDKKIKAYGKKYWIEKKKRKLLCYYETSISKWARVKKRIGLLGMRL